VDISLGVHLKRSEHARSDARKKKNKRQNSARGRKEGRQRGQPPQRSREDAGELNDSDADVPEGC